MGLLFFLFFSLVLGQDVVQTSKGKVRGLCNEYSCFFGGIPFADPPVGDLRFSPPVPYSSSWKLRDGTRFGNDCIPVGPSLGNTSEDCLFLNVFAPRRPFTKKLPVGLWIYGGAWQIGASSTYLYNATRMLELRQDVVIVSMNYRLGALGFLASSELGLNGNYGLLDQRAAMTWVQQEISNFGGDPERVTIWGESAGAASVGLHLLMPNSWPYFHQAIQESGPISSWSAKPMSLYNVVTDYLGKTLGCDPKSLLSCLRGVSAEKLQAITDVGNVEKNATDIPSFNYVMWSPVVDGDEIVDFPMKLLHAEKIAKDKTVMLGTNTDEASILFPMLAQNHQFSESTELDFLNLRLGTEYAKKAMLEYPSKDYSSIWWAAESCATDFMMACPTRYQARQMSKTAPVYLYQFNHELEMFKTTPDFRGVFHMMELFFVFAIENRTYDGTPFYMTPEEAILRDSMVNTWVDFITTGVPNSKWPKYEDVSDESWNFNLTQSLVSGLKKQKCDFWETIDLLQNPK